MIENNPKAAACIRENLEHTKLADKALLIERDVISGLKRLEGKNYRFDVIFMDPPYNHGHEQTVLSYLAGSPMVTEDTLLIIEASKETDFSWIAGSGFHLIKIKDYKTNKHVFVGKGD
jgi:16S rRNA G966 N2-methylase RsmD